ncbi:MmgE/PrpD family protein [Alkalicaulis satelles]|uniref:MmgE/PrpD family protein n=1 Tax=Alkalicaulis satelles TaxID=2609175 RepID=A0A5M6ZJN2_9PROT|nr:MmgE/PrpD family protein [Alkalicaulis satelles]KAA5804550.1 MmgE/PrpD family protein [Alkalicaulis satelles]
MSGQSSTLTRRLADRLARPVDAAVRARAALHVLDWAGCALAGANSPAGQAMARSLAGEGPGPCTLIGAARGGSPLTAALHNGALGNVLEMDDVDKRAILHPGPGVIPAALAACESAGADAHALLDAVVRGYEAVIALGRAVGPGHYAFWHNTGTCGPFGAAAAAASVFGLNEDRTAHALGLAGTQASGFWQTRHEPGSMAKQLHTARAAHAGLAAARLASEGFDGPLAILEGPQGFFAATCPGADSETVMAGHGEPWLIEQVSFKPWPACRHAHAAIDAALAARADGVEAGDIAGIALITYRDALTFCDRSRPESVIEAKFSLQHAVAVTLLRGEPQLSDFEPDAFTAPDVRALASKVSVSAGSPYDGAYPARYGAGMGLVLSDGAQRQYDQPDALGDPENPLTEDKLAAKARALAVHGGLDAGTADRLVEAALALADGGSLNAFTALIASPARPGETP